MSDYDVWSKPQVSFTSLEAGRVALRDENLLSPFFDAWTHMLDKCDASKSLGCCTAVARTLPTHGVNVLMIGEAGGMLYVHLSACRFLRSCAWFSFAYLARASMHTHLHTHSLSFSLYAYKHQHTRIKYLPAHSKVLHHAAHATDTNQIKKNKSLKNPCTVNLPDVFHLKSSLWTDKFSSKVMKILCSFYLPLTLSSTL
jgi:hypothetical protein